MSADEKALREEELRKFVREPYLGLFDKEFYEQFGRYPSSSPLFGTTPTNTARRRAIQNLIEQGATEGERAAAAAALARLDARSEADDLEAIAIEDQDELDAEEVAEAEQWGL